MKQTRRFVVALVVAFLGLLGLALGYQVVALTDDVPNNAISHAVGDLTRDYPNLPHYFLGFLVTWFVWWLTCYFHWWGTLKFWWRRAVYKDDPRTPEDESLRNLHETAAPMDAPGSDPGLDGSAGRDGTKRVVGPREDL